MPLVKEIELFPGCRERVVQFEVNDQMVRGNLIQTGPDAAVGALILHGWGGVRSGPHGLLTVLARKLGELGVPSIRFDLRGRGESDGSATAADLVTMAEDGLAAAKILQSEAGVRKLLLIGICSGGNVGIGLLDRLPDVESLFLLSVYPFGDGDSFKRDAQRTAKHLKEYWKKLWLKETWKKLVRGGIDFRTIFQIITKPLRRNKKKAPAKATAKEETTETRPIDNLLLNRPKALMLYGDTDPDYEGSRAYYEGFAEQQKYPIRILTIAGANHNFYSMEWTEQIINELKGFLKEGT